MTEQKNVVEQSILIPDVELEYDNIELDLEDLPVKHVGAPPDRALIDSIRTYGLMNPLMVVAETGHNADGEERTGFVVIDGRRRLAALHILASKDDRWRTVPCRLVDAEGSVEQAMTLTANAARRPNPVSEFFAIKRLIEDGATPKQITAATGLPANTIEKRMQLMALEEPFLDGIISGKVAISTAEQIAKLPESRRKQLLATLESEGKLTYVDVRDAKRVVVDDSMAKLPFETFLSTPSSAEMSATIPKPARNAAKGDDPNRDTLTPDSVALRAIQEAVSERVREALVEIESLASGKGPMGARLESIRQAAIEALAELNLGDGKR